MHAAADRIHPALRGPAGARDSRQAAIFTRRRFQSTDRAGRNCGNAPGTANQGGGQSRSSGQSGSHQRAVPGERAGSIRPRPRSRSHLFGDGRSWDEFLVALRTARAAARQRRRGFRNPDRNGDVAVPRRTVEAVLKAFPEARWHQYEPAGSHSARAGAQRSSDGPFTLTTSSTKPMLWCRSIPISWPAARAARDLRTISQCAGAAGSGWT